MLPSLSRRNTSLHLQKKKRWKNGACFFSHSASYSIFPSWASPSICPTLICHQTVVYGRSAFQSLRSSSTSRPPSSIHPLHVLKAQSMMAVPSDAFFPSSVFPPQSIHPPSLPALPLPSFIFPQSPAVSASVSEPSPPRTWRPRSPAPRKGSELEHRKGS